MDAQGFLEAGVQVFQAGGAGDGYFGCGGVGTPDLGDEIAESGGIAEEVVCRSCAMVRSFH